MSRPSVASVAARTAQALVVGGGLCVAVGEASEQYDASRFVVYASRHLRERRQRLRDAIADPQSQASEAAWLQREQPKFPYLLALSPADNPAVVTHAVLGADDHIIGSADVSTEATLESVMAPSSPLDALVRVLARRWAAVKTKLHGDVPRELLDPTRSALHHRLDALRLAMQECSQAEKNDRETLETPSGQEESSADNSRVDASTLVFYLGDFDTWDDVATTLWLQWVHEITSTGLAHVVLPTTQPVTPTTIREWQRCHKVRDADFVAILLRVAAKSSDSSTAHDKLRTLSQLHALELRGLDDASNENQELDEEGGDAGFEAKLPTEVELIVETVGNWWSDLERVCQLLETRGLRKIDSEEERMVLVQSVCEEVEQETVTHVLQALSIQEESPADASTSTDSERRISTLQAWKCLEVVTQVGDKAQILASPQTLLQKKNDKPLNCAHAVEALLPFNQRTHGEAKFMELIDQRVLFLRPKNDVEIGVVPCDAKALVGPCWVQTRPIVKRAFDKLWRDDFYYHRVLELERFEDNHKLSDEITLFEQEISDKRRAFDAQTREFIMLQRVMKKEDVAKRKAELALLELEIQSKHVYLERLRELLE